MAKLLPPQGALEVLPAGPHPRRSRLQAAIRPDVSTPAAVPDFARARRAMSPVLGASPGRRGPAPPTACCRPGGGPPPAASADAGRRTRSHLVQSERGVAEQDQRDRRGCGRGRPQDAGELAEGEFAFQDAVIEALFGSEVHGRAFRECS